MTMDLEDLASDERWNAGVNYAITQLCFILGVDPKSISWDAATETLDGDVSSVICNAIRGAYGDEWSSKPETTARILAALAPPVEAEPVAPIEREMHESIINRLASLTVGTCSCGTMSHELKYHAATCRYRIAAEALELARALFTHPPAAQPPEPFIKGWMTDQHDKSSDAAAQPPDIREALMCGACRGVGYIAHYNGMHEVRNQNGQYPWQVRVILEGLSAKSREGSLAS